MAYVSIHQSSHIHLFIYNPFFIILTFDLVLDRKKKEAEEEPEPETVEIMPRPPPYEDHDHNVIGAVPTANQRGI